MTERVPWSGAAVVGGQDQHQMPSQVQRVVDRVDERAEQYGDIGNGAQVLRRKPAVGEK